jgi:hypothetical protein
MEDSMAYKKEYSKEKFRPKSGKSWIRYVK